VKNPTQTLSKLILVSLVVFAFGAAAFQTASTRYVLPSDQQFTSTGRQLLSISPDARRIVYVANNRLHVKGISDPEAKVIPGTETAQGVTNPVFSPDGMSVVYWSGADQTLKRISINGGTAQTLCPAGNPFGMSWSGDQILFGQGSAGIRRIAATGGTPETLVTVKTGELAHGPQLLPGGTAILYTLANSTSGGSLWDTAKIVAHTLKSNESKILFEGGADARYAPTGHMVLARGGTVGAIRFDAERLQVTGGPIALMGGVRNAGTTTGTTQFSFSENGTLIYLSTASTEVQLSFVDLSGPVKPVRTIPAGAFGPRISPDGKQVAYRVGDAVWIADLSGNTPPRRLNGAERGDAPVWSPDGQRIVFISNFNGQEALFSRRADGSGAAELLVDRARAPESWSAVHDAVSYITLVGPAGDAGDYDIWTYSFKDKKATPLVAIPPSAQSGSRFSPDGRWMAYESNESGRAEIYVETVPPTGQRFRITKNGGARPVWAPDSTKLYFDNNAGNPTRLFSSNIRTQPAFTFTEPEPLPITGFIQPQGTYRRQFDITSDGRQFVTMFPAPPAAAGIEIVSGWFDRLR
jgi:serine/threonine-protein kinase